MHLCQACSYPNKVDEPICDYCAEIVGTNNAIAKYDNYSNNISILIQITPEYSLKQYKKSIKRQLYFSYFFVFITLPTLIIIGCLHPSTILFLILALPIFWVIDKLFFIPYIEYLVIGFLKKRSNRLVNKKLKTKLFNERATLKPEYENLKLVKQEKEKRNLKVAISTANSSIKKLNQQIAETNIVIQQVQTSNAITETEKKSILQKLNNTLDFLEFNLNKFLNFHFELKLVERLCHFEFLKWDYQNNGKVSKKLLNENLQIIQTIKNQLSYHELVEITMKFETLHQLLLKYKHLDEREDIKTKLDKIAEFDTSTTNQIDNKVSINLEEDFMNAKTHENYLNEFWHDYHQLEEAADKMDIINKLKFLE